MTDENSSPTTRIPTPGPQAGDAGDAGGDRPPDRPAHTPPAGPPPVVVPAAVTPPPTEPTTPLRDSTGGPPPDGSQWRPPPRDDRGRLASVLFGLVLLAIGLWFFAEHTLGIDLPTIRWGQLWPVFLILLGGWILLGTLRRNSR